MFSVTYLCTTVTLIGLDMHQPRYRRRQRETDRSKRCREFTRGKNKLEEIQTWKEAGNMNWETDRGKIYSLLICRSHRRHSRDKVVVVYL